MSAIRFVEDFQTVDELVQALNQYRGSGLVLCSKQLLRSKRIAIETAIAKVREYDFGGEADIWIDLAISPEHFIFNYLKEKKHG